MLHIDTIRVLDAQMLQEGRPVYPLLDGRWG